MSLLKELAEFSRRYTAADAAPGSRLRPESLKAFNERWERNEAAYRYLAGDEREPGHDPAPDAASPHPLASGRYAAKLRTGGVLRHLGTFDTPDEAAAAVAREMGGGSRA